MHLTSDAYADGATMPARFATRNVDGGTGASVPLDWAGAPETTRSYVLEMIDHHPVAHEWLHWMVIDLPADSHHLDEGASGSPAMPPGAVEPVNTAGRPGYGGPQPPVGSGVHDYEIVLSALDIPRLGLGADATHGEVLSAMRGHVLARASLLGRFGR